jgi:hypothetical protein
MGFRDSMRQRRFNLTGRESVEQLADMEGFFQGGTNWTRGAYERSNGTKCLVGAANYVRRTTGNSLGEAKYWLLQAIAERGGTGIEGFNDTRTSYREVGEVIWRAKQLALAARSPAPAVAPPRALPPPRPALPSLPVFAVETPSEIGDFIDVEWHEIGPDDRARVPVARRR